MAKDNGNNTVTVVKGDTLWDIAKVYLKDATKYQWLADINGIPNPNLIYPGQIIKLSGSSTGSGAGSSGSSSSGSGKKSSNGVTVDGPHLQSDSDNTLFVTWTWGKASETKSYAVVWEYYDPSFKEWFVGTSTAVSVDENYEKASRYHTYNIPSNASLVRFKIKPLPKEEGEGNTKKYAFTPVGWSKWYQFNVNSIPPSEPPAPSIEIDKFNQLTATLENLDLDALEATHIVFQIVKNDNTSIHISSNIKINTNFKQVSYSYTVPAGNKYKVRCKSVRDKLESEWSQFSNEDQAIPSTPSRISCKASNKVDDKYSVYVAWGKIDSAETYDIQYTEKKEYFDNVGGSVSSASTEDARTSVIIYGFEKGAEYFFRVRAKNNKGESGWSEIKSVILGDEPKAPTTWSSTISAVVGEPLNLYWVHNSEDGSDQTKAKLELDDASGDIETIVVPAVKNEDEEDKTSVYSVDTSKYNEGTVLKWRVQTAGVTGNYGEWSIIREVKISAVPKATMNVSNKYPIDNEGMSTLTHFPFYMKCTVEPTTQKPVSYHVSITANEMYETIDQLGNEQTISVGDQVYSKHFDISDPLFKMFSASDVDLQNGIEYTITCTASMDSGLNATESSTFRVDWGESTYVPDAEIIVDRDVYSASIRPYCESHTSVLRALDYNGVIFTVTSEKIDESSFENIYTTTGERVYCGYNLNGDLFYYSVLYTDASGNSIDPVYRIVKYSGGEYVTTGVLVDVETVTRVLTETGEEVLLGINADGIEKFYCVYDETKLIEGVSLAVYRREFDGSFTEIASGIDNLAHTFVTDPHPALNYARYRIVATELLTGAVSYHDITSYLIGCKSIIIQWDDDWSDFNYWTEDERSQPTWSGSMLNLPYNIDVSDSNSPDVSHIKYIGRKRPVTYYGTQLGETSTWNTTIPKDDLETIYALRRLSTWMGDVYVREPSGTGYWANVRVSFSLNHCEVSVPVTFSITRVEGGI